MLRALRSIGASLALTLSACNNGPPATGPTLIVTGGTIASMPQDQKYLAYYTGAAMLDNGAPVGALSVMTLPGGTPLPLNGNAFGAQNGASGGETLLFFTEPAASTDTGSHAIYGALHAWTPALSSEVRVTQGLAVLWAAPPGHGFVIAWDAPKPTRDQTGNLLLVLPPACTPTVCPSQTLVMGETVAAVAASLDGRYAAWVLRKPGAVMGRSRYETFLYSIGDGLRTMVAVTSGTTALGTAPIAFSPDGTLLAAAEEVVGGTPLQLKVVATASGQPVAWGALPPQTGVVQLGFADSATLIVHARSNNDAEAGIYRTSATSAASMLVPSGYEFAVEHDPPGAERYLFVAGAKDVTDLLLVDLQAAMPTAVMIASATIGFPRIAPDLSSAALLDKVDTTNNFATGMLTLAALPSGDLTSLADGVSGVGGATAWAGEPTILFYVGGPDTSGAGSLAMWQAGATQVVDHGVLDLRVRVAPDAFYYSVIETDVTEMPPRVPGVYQALSWPPPALSGM
jgi:hypothetical protein